MTVSLGSADRSGNEDWTAYVESRLGAWIEAMLELPQDATERDIHVRQGIAENLRACGLIVTGDSGDRQWKWSVKDGFGTSDYERLADL